MFAQDATNRWSRRCERENKRETTKIIDYRSSQCSLSSGSIYKRCNDAQELHIGVLVFFFFHHIFIFLCSNIRRYLFISFFLLFLLFRVLLDAKKKGPHRPGRSRGIRTFRYQTLLVIISTRVCLSLAASRVSTILSNNTPKDIRRHGGAAEEKRNTFRIIRLHNGSCDWHAECDLTKHL